MRTFSAALVTALLVVIAGVAVAPAKTSHDGWPKRNGILKIAPNSNTSYTGTSRNDELLGGDGSDTLDGGAGDDVLWGDKNPSGQPATQKDVISGGGGKDWIYSSHGTNTIAAGAGADHVKAHFGKGTIDCGPGNDVLWVSHKAKPHYKIRGCEKISFKSVGF